MLDFDGKFLVTVRWVFTVLALVAILNAIFHGRLLDIFVLGAFFLAAVPALKDDVKCFRRHFGI